MNSLLFLCTGNYYRSRYAEILFNWHARSQGLAWSAFSRGLAPDPLNPGPMSRHTLAALSRQQIAHDEYMRMPILVTNDDFAAADHVVAVKEAEHRRMIEQGFAPWLPKVEFWARCRLLRAGRNVASFGSRAGGAGRATQKIRGNGIIIVIERRNKAGEFQACQF
jgi:protein-tyrosine phosphatase